MTNLYRPVLIESAEQAEALPVGTVAILDDATLPVALHVIKTAEHLMPWRNGKHVGADENVVGAQALVPIEAEEERQAIAECEIGVPGTERIVHEHRFVTPWEER